MRLAALALAAVGCAVAAPAREPDLVNAEWPASWVTCPGAPARGTGVYHFRKQLTLARRPEAFVIHVSADNRFLLFVNGVRVGEGPARADLDHWRYETYDLAAHLHAGANVIAATVWNYGGFAPVVQMSDQTGFLVQGDTPAESDANTDASWEVEPERGQGFAPVRQADVPNYYAATPPETFDAALYDWDWTDPERSSGPSWVHAVAVGTGEAGRYPHGCPSGTGSGLNRWLLVPDPLPAMAYEPAEAGRIVRSRGLGDAAALPARIAPHTEATVLFDRGAMTTGFARLEFSGGKGAELRVTYAEALVDAHGRKGNRNEVEGRSILGLVDTVACDGGDHRSWTSLSWRAWRYLQVDVRTGDEALTLGGLGVTFTGYPFVERGGFSASDPDLATIWKVGVRTARMNAHETYSDCPYWEQLQYLGDTRIQALISYTAFGDDRLARQALDAYDASRSDEGLTQSRYPSALPQYIPTFSLLWIGMLHDYWMYRPDPAPLARWVPHTRGVLEWYARHLRADGLLGRMPWWNFGDWTADFVFGVPPQDADGGSALLSLDYMAALRDGADLEEAVGNPALAAGYRERAAAVGRAVFARCWAPEAGLLAETPARTHFSEQANAMALLMDVVPPADRGRLVDVLLGAKAPVSLSAASIYFRFYVARALDHAGMADRYLGTLGPWRGMIARGLSTWAETEEPTRSDDHAWSAHPTYDLLTLVAGIHPASPGFAAVRIAPQPGSLTEVSATLPHPAGPLLVHYVLKDATWTFEVTLPPGVTGTLEWNGAATPLKPGPNTLRAVRR